MLIESKSVLNKVGQIKINERFPYSLEALVEIIKMTDLSYTRLSALLKNCDSHSPEEITMQAWLVVGNMNRLRCLIDKVSGIKKSEPWYQLFMRQIKDVENVRHMVEHYDQQLNRLMEEVQPILGYVAWLEPSDGKKIQSIMLLPGTIRKYKGLFLVNPAGKTIRNSVDHVTYVLGNSQVNVSEIYYQMVAFTKELETYIDTAYFSK